MTDPRGPFASDKGAGQWSSHERRRPGESSRSLRRMTNPSSHLLRNGWLFGLALLMQVGAAYPGALRVPAPVVLWLVPCSYIVLLVGVLRNGHLWSLRLFLAGLILNMVAMALNGWRMPITPEALAQAGYSTEASLEIGSYLSSTKGVLLLRADTRAWVLTDIVAVPQLIGTVFSIGDLLMLTSVVLAVVELIVVYNTRSNARQSSHRTCASGVTPKTLACSREVP